MTFTFFFISLTKQSHIPLRYENDRKDKANKYRIQDVVTKPESEKGKYLVPELYGKTIEYSTQRPSYLEKGSPIHQVRNPLDDPKLKVKR